MNTNMSKNQQHKPATWALPRVEGFKNKRMARIKTNALDPMVLKMTRGHLLHGAKP